VLSLEVVVAAVVVAAAATATNWVNHNVCASKHAGCVQKRGFYLPECCSNTKRHTPGDRKGSRQRSTPHCEQAHAVDGARGTLGRSRARISRQITANARQNPTDGAADTDELWQSRLSADLHAQEGPEADDTRHPPAAQTPGDQPSRGLLARAYRSGYFPTDGAREARISREWSRSSRRGRRGRRSRRESSCRPGAPICRSNEKSV